MLGVDLVVVVELEEHAESRPNPAALTISSRRSCMRRRFLKPSRQTATASVAPGRKGRDPPWTAAAAVVGEIESVVTADWPATTVMGLGLNEQLYPEGAPLQANDTVPANELTELTVSCVTPTVPDWIVSVGSEKSRVNDGSSPVGLTMKLRVTGAAAAKVTLSPGCVAVMVHRPEVTNVVVVPETVHTDEVDEVNITAKPEVAVAESVRGVPRTWVPGLLKVMVWVGSGARTLIVS